MRRRRRPLWPAARARPALPRRMTLSLALPHTSLAGMQWMHPLQTMPAGCRLPTGRGSWAGPAGCAARLAGSHPRCCGAHDRDRSAQQHHCGHGHDDELTLVPAGGWPQCVSSRKSQHPRNGTPADMALIVASFSATRISYGMHLAVLSTAALGTPLMVRAMGAR